MNIHFIVNDEIELTLFLELVLLNPQCRFTLPKVPCRSPGGFLRNVRKRLNLYAIFKVHTAYCLYHSVHAVGFAFASQACSLWLASRVIARERSATFVAPLSYIPQSTSFVLFRGTRNLRSSSRYSSNTVILHQSVALASKLAGRRSDEIPRNYPQDFVEIKGFEPLTPCLQSRCSPS